MRQDIRHRRLIPELLFSKMEKFCWYTKIMVPGPCLADGAQSVLDKMSNMLGPLGMLLAGMVIADKPLSSVFSRKRSYLSALLRLIIYPVLVLPLMKIIYLLSSLADAKNVLMIVYLASITPACAAVTSMAQLYDSDAAYSSSLYVLTTLLSVVTMPVMIYLFQMVI